MTYPCQAVDVAGWSVLHPDLLDRDDPWGPWARCGAPGELVRVSGYDEAVALCEGHRERLGGKEETG